MFVKPEYPSLKNEIEDKLFTLDIYQYYLNVKINKLPYKMKSPLRDEHNPSFNIYSFKDSILWKDFTLNISGDIYELLMKMYNMNFPTVLLKIKHDIIEKQFILADRHKYNVRKEIQVKTNSTINLLPYHFLESENPKSYYNFWKQYKVITMNILRKNNVKACKYLYMNGQLYDTYKDNDIIISYSEKRTNDLKIYYKTYKPYNKENKWLSNYRGSSKWLIHGLQHINKLLNYIIITKSVKDKMILEALEYNVVNVQNEGISIPEKIMNYLKSLYDNIYLLYDNDYNKSKNWGQIDAKKLIKQYPFIKNVYIDGRYKCTDIGEFISKYDIEKTQNLLKKIIKI